MTRGSRDAPDPWGPELMPHPYEQIPQEGRPVREPSSPAGTSRPAALRSRAVT